MNFYMKLKSMVVNSFLFWLNFMKLKKILYTEKEIKKFQKFEMNSMKKEIREFK